MQDKSLIKNTLILILGTTLPKVMTFITIPLYTFFLTKMEYGAYDLILTLSTLLIPLLTLQLHSAIFRYLLDADTNEQQKKVISTSFVVIIGIIFLFLLIWIMLPIKYSMDVKIFIYLYFVLNLIYQVLLEIVRGLGLKKNYTLAAILNAGLIGITSIGFLYLISNKMGAALLSLDVAFLFTILYLIKITKLWKYLSLNSVNIQLLKEMLSYSIPLVPNSLSWWIMNVSDRFIITYFMGFEWNAIYAIANKIPSIYSLLYNGFNLAWQESAILSSDDREKYYQNTFDTLCDILFGGLLLLISVLPFIFKILVIGDYGDAYYQMPILCVSLLFSSLSAFFGGIYIAHKQSKKIGVTSLIAAVINFAVNILFIENVGLFAASLSTLISFLILTLYRYYDISKTYILRYDVRKFFIFVFSLIIVIFNYYFLNYLLLIIGVIASMIIFMIFNKEYLIKIIGRVKKYEKK